MPLRPPWVVKDLSAILGFDEATVSEAILPELESQTHQVKLQSHLQDFLGPTPQAKAFIDKYISYRFPSIPAPTPSAPPSLKTNSQPTAAGATSRGNSKPASKVGTPSATGYSGHDRDLGRAVSDAFAFGPSGTVYNKNALADAGSSRGGSGSNTPQFRQPGRSGGALTIHEAKAKDKGKGKAAATGGSGGSGGGKGDKIWDVPKSREVKRLEGLKGKLKMVQDGEKVKRDDEVPDCFCQARIHTLSTYTPHCPHCGLVLCTLQPPYLPCPSCLHPLYSPAQLARLILRVEAEIETQLAKEQADRDALEREAHQRALEQSGGGAFPTLPGGGAGRTPAAVDNTRKVLSIGSGKGKGKGKATLTTTTYRSAPSTPAEPATPAVPVDTVPRPRSPPLEPSRAEKEWNKVDSWRKEEDRPWGDMKADKKGEVWTYVELPLSHWIEEDSEGRRKAAKKKGKDGRGEGGRVVPGAA